MTNLNHSRILLVVTFTSLAILVYIVGVAPAFGQEAGPSNPNANVTTAYNLLHGNNQTVSPSNPQNQNPSTTDVITVNNTGILGNYVVANLTNNQNKEQKITYVVQCQDANGVIGGIEATSAGLAAGQKFSASQACSNYVKTAQIFILESLTNPIVLSKPLLITSETNAESPSQNYNGSSITLSGTVNVPVVENEVILFVLGPGSNIIQIAQADVGSGGNFFTSIKTGGFGFTQSGTYVVKVYSDGIPQKNLTFNYNATTGQAIAESTSTPQSNNMTGSVMVTSTNIGEITVTTSYLSSFILQINGSTFKSFTLENGWAGMKTSPTTLAFDAISPTGGVAIFEIKTDQQTPIMTWKALDASNHELGSGQIVSQLNASQSIPAPTSQLPAPTQQPTSVFTPTLQDIQNINQAKANQTIAAEVNVGSNQAQTTSIDNNVSVRTTQNTPDSLGVQVSATNQTGPKVIAFNLNTTTINVANLKDLGVMYDGKLIQPAPNMDAILHAKPTDNPSFAIVVTQSGVQVLVLIPHFSTHSITITNMSKVITPTVPEFPFSILALIIAMFSIILIPKIKQI